MALIVFAGAIRSGSYHRADPIPDNGDLPDAYSDLRRGKGNGGHLKRRHHGRPG